MPPRDHDPFARGPHPVGVRTLELEDPDRGRRFPCELWAPATAEHAGRDLDPDTQDAFGSPLGDEPRRQAAVRDAACEPGARPLVLFSHSTGGGRRQSTFLCTHLASHGYAVAALDHSESVAPELARAPDEDDERKRARQAAWLAARVEDVRFLARALLERGADGALPEGLVLDASRVALAGHSLGGWTVLAAPDVEPRVRAVVALAPAGGRPARPGILSVPPAFAWGRDVPTLLVAGEADASIPVDSVRELRDRVPAERRLVVLAGADHLHFMDEGARLHDALRSIPWPGELAWLPGAMRPLAELATVEGVHVATRGLALAHLDASLKGDFAARALLDEGVEDELARRGVAAFAG